MIEPGTPRTITVGHSPDPDDAFMFYALARGKIDTAPYRFEHRMADIETLNREALAGALEVTAVSYHAYPAIAERYALLACGSSMGDGYGPLLVARAPQQGIADGQLVAIPGEMTSAHLALRLYAGRPLRTQVVPFDRIPDEVAAGRADLGLVIHEGQLTYADAGLARVVDLGAWWKQTTGLPLPLGANVIRRDLGPAAMREIARHLRRSIAYALDHRREAVAYALEFGRGLDVERTDRFVGMYVNAWTLELGADGRRAVELFLARGREIGMIRREVSLELVRDAAVDVRSSS